MEWAEYYQDAPDGSSFELAEPGPPAWVDELDAQRARDLEDWGEYMDGMELAKQREIDEYIEYQRNWWNYLTYLENALGYKTHAWSWRLQTTTHLAWALLKSEYDEEYPF